MISGGALMFIVAPAIFVSGLLTLFIDAGIAQADAVINFVEKVHGGEGTND
jgi:Mg2+/Co2+ transporter CorB